MVRGDLKNSVRFISQNVRGLNETKLEEIIMYMRNSNAAVVCLQETWIVGDRRRSNSGFLIIEHGCADKPATKGHVSGGVAIILSPSAVLAFKKAGERVAYFGDRIMSISLDFVGSRNEVVSVYLAVAYSPIGAADVLVRAEYLRNFERCCSHCRNDQVLLIGADANASLGIRRDVNDTVLGPHGPAYVNAAGHELYQMLATASLCAPSSFYQKSSYDTWFSPRTRKGHQLDHFFIRKKDFKRVTNSGKLASMLADSDHYPVALTLRIARRLLNTNARMSRAQSTKPSMRVNRSLLREEHVQNRFVDAVKAGVLGVGGPVGCEDFQKLLVDTANDTLTEPDRKQHSWFAKQEQFLQPTILQRNVAQKDYQKSKSLRHLEILKKARLEVKRQVERAKTIWREERISKANDLRHAKEAFKAINELNMGESNSVSCAPQIFKNKDGVLAVSPADNLENVRSHYAKVFNAECPFLDVAAVDEIKQRDMADYLDLPPSVEEIRTAFAGAKNDKAAGDSNAPVELWKACLTDMFLFNYVMSIILVFWNSGALSTGWNFGRLKLLPKKGDLSDLNNWRGIMLMDAIVKMIGSIISKRLQTYLLTFGIEAQNGFMPSRGCTDGIFILKETLLKRSEHNLDSWVIFIDLIKAFDSVPRDLLYLVLAKFGIPAKLIALIKALHSGCKVKIRIGETDVEIDNTAGVKQGDTLAPILFIIFFQLAMEVVEIHLNNANLGKPTFRTKQDDVMTGRDCKIGGRSKRNCLEFTMRESFFADDGAFVFLTRPALISGANILYFQLRRFGLLCHVSRNGSASKSEAMFFPAANRHVADGDTTPFPVDGDGLINFCSKFKYLGGLLVNSLSDADEVKSRIGAASRAYGLARRHIFTSPLISKETKRRAYESLILGILLYGSETWVLTSEMRRQLSVFHHGCVRRMCHVTWKKSWHHHIRASDLELRMGLKSMEYYLAKRRLGWFGNVMRMDFQSRLPRQLLTSFVFDHPRKSGGQYKTYGASLDADFKMVGIDNRKDVDLTVLSANATVWSTLLDRLENTDRRKWKPIDIPYRNVPLAALANIPAPLLQQNNAAPAAVPIIPAQFDFRREKSL